MMTAELRTALPSAKYSGCCLYGKPVKRRDKRFSANTESFRLSIRGRFLEPVRGFVLSWADYLEAVTYWEALPKEKPVEQPKIVKPKRKKYMTRVSEREITRRAEEVWRRKAVPGYYTSRKPLQWGSALGRL